MQHVREAMGTSFLIAMLGFFESSVAAKTLSGGDPKTGEGLHGTAVKPNGELVALGVANLIGGCFMALPAFGGYARSKVNASTGGRTPMSSVFLSFITVICVLFLLPYFYYLPVSRVSSVRLKFRMLTDEESSTFGYDIGGCVLPHRRSPPRY